MTLECRRCGEPIPAEDTDQAGLVARCRACHTVFDFSAELGGNSHEFQRPRQQPRPRVPLPPGLMVSTDRSQGIGANREREITITRRWFVLTQLYLVFLVVAWQSSLVFWTSLESASILIHLGAVIHIAVGLGLTYHTAAQLLNRTEITVAHGELRVHIGPLPWRGNLRISAHEVTQLYCEEQRRDGEPTRCRYEVHVILSDGRTLKLLARLTEPAQALYIEQAIEDAMGLVDVEVPGEFTGEAEVVPQAEQR